MACCLALIGSSLYKSRPGEKKYNAPGLLQGRCGAWGVGWVLPLGLHNNIAHTALLLTR
jgi:hypothetical protein